MKLPNGDRDTLVREPVIPVRTGGYTDRKSPDSAAQQAAETTQELPQCSTLLPAEGQEAVCQRLLQRLGMACQTDIQPPAAAGARGICQHLKVSPGDLGST